MTNKKLDEDWDDEELIDFDEELLPGLQDMLASIAAKTYDTHKEFWYADNISQEQRDLYMYLPRSRQEH